MRIDGSLFINFCKNAAVASLEAEIITKVYEKLVFGKEAGMRVPAFISPVLGGIAGNTIVEAPLQTQLGIVILTGVVAAVMQTVTGVEQERAIVTGVGAGTLVAAQTLGYLYKLNQKAILAGLGIGAITSVAFATAEVSAPIFSAIGIGVSGMTAGFLACI